VTFTRRRYQQGCLYREKRKAGPNIWVFRFRDGETNRKERIGTVDEFPTRSAAMKACEPFRAKINLGVRLPRTVAGVGYPLPREGIDGRQR
jgi:hypothetical protein